MALAKSNIIDKIEVVDSGDWKMVQVRTATVITEDGTELSRSFSRHVISPSDDWTSEDSEVQAICNAVHTSTRITAYNNRPDAP